MKKLILVFAFLALVVGCSDDDSECFIVGSKPGFICGDGGMITRCLIYKSKPSDSWHSGLIVDGFSPVPGYEYIIEVENVYPKRIDEYYNLKYVVSEVKKESEDVPDGMIWQDYMAGMTCDSLYRLQMEKNQ